MALVASGFRTSVTMIDTAGDSTILQFPLAVADMAAAIAATANLLTSLAGLSTAAVQSYSIASLFLETALTYPVGSEIEDEAFFTGKIIGAPNKSGNTRIPSPIIGMFTATEGPGRNIVDTTFPALVTYLGYFDGSPVTVSDGEGLVLSSIVGKRRKKGSKVG